LVQSQVTITIAVGNKVAYIFTLCLENALRRGYLADMSKTPPAPHMGGFVKSFPQGRIYTAGPTTRVQHIIPALDVYNAADWLDVRNLELMKFEVGVDIQFVGRM
jgi:hypothetical protein